MLYCEMNLHAFRCSSIIDCIVSSIFFHLLFLPSRDYILKYDQKIPGYFLGVLEMGSSCGVHLSLLGLDMSTVTNLCAFPNTHILSYRYPGRILLFYLVEMLCLQLLPSALQFAWKAWLMPVTAEWRMKGTFSIAFPASSTHCS